MCVSGEDSARSSLGRIRLIPKGKAPVLGVHFEKLRLTREGGTFRVYAFEKSLGWVSGSPQDGGDALVCTRFVDVVREACDSEILYSSGSAKIPRGT